LVEPQHVMYGSVTLDDVPAIIEAVEKGATVERLHVEPTNVALGRG
jgi:(2Fe-2S) ferredoxin